VARLTALRSLLYVPGNRQRFFAKLAELHPDGVIFDLEDAVPPAE
jgi:citrate lyase subunit beta/citryl-CoA lyase